MKCKVTTFCIAFHKARENTPVCQCEPQKGYVWSKHCSCRYRQESSERVRQAEKEKNEIQKKLEEAQAQHEQDKQNWNKRVSRQNRREVLKP